MLQLCREAPVWDIWQQCLLRSNCPVPKCTTLLLLLVSLTFPWIKYLNEFNANLRIFRKLTSNSELINLNAPAVCIFFCRIEKNMAVDNLLLAKIVYLCRRSEDWRHLSIKNERVHFILHSVCAVFVAMNSFTLNKAEYGNS